VSHEDFTDAALVLVGHGSTTNVDSAAPVYQHAAELRRRKLFAEVREAFWQQDPRMGEVVEDILSVRVFVLPLFISEGYFSDRVIPQALRFRTGDEGSFCRVVRRDYQTFIYCKPVGTHDSMTGVLLARARAVVGQFPFPRAPDPKDTTLFIVGHGTSRDENSRKAIERQVGLIRAMKEYANVHGVFLEEEPRIGECYRLAQTRFVIIVPFFISDGMHTQEDMPVLLGETKRIVQQRLAAGQPAWRNPTEKHGKLVWYAPAVGTAPEIIDVILERVRETTE
jgi:sirohydrochlorin cobaltochelatase